MTVPACTTSSHYVSSDVRKIQSVPFPQPRTADEQGQLLSHHLIALGAFDTDLHILSLLDLSTTSSTTSTTAYTTPTTLASWEHPGGEVTDLHVSSQPNGTILLLAGSSSGSITRLQMLVPQAPGSHPRDIQLLGSDVRGQQLTSWAHPHQGRVAFVCHQSDENVVLSGGQDGRLWMAGMEEDVSSREAWYQGGAGVSFTAGAWASPQSFVTASTTGGLATWDRRGPPKPTGVAPATWGPAGSAAVERGPTGMRRLRCVTVHPTQPHVAATGATGGLVALWDLRFAKQPMHHTVQGDGDVHKVVFAPARAASQATPQCFFCTDDGVLACTSASASTTRHTVAEALVLHEEPCASLRDVDVCAGTGQGELEVVAATDQEHVLFSKVVVGL